jgi:hypothetical protein
MHRLPAAARRRPDHLAGQGPEPRAAPGSGPPPGHRIRGVASRASSSAGRSLPAWMVSQPDSAAQSPAISTPSSWRWPLSVPVTNEARDLGGFPRRAQTFQQTAVHGHVAGQMLLADPQTTLLPAFPHLASARASPGRPAGAAGCRLHAGPAQLLRQARGITGRAEDPCRRPAMGRPGPPIGRRLAHRGHPGTVASGYDLTTAPPSTRASQACRRPGGPHPRCAAPCPGPLSPAAGGPRRRHCTSGAHPGCARESAQAQSAFPGAQLVLGDAGAQGNGGDGVAGCGGSNSWRARRDFAQLLSRFTRFSFRR